MKTLVNENEKKETTERASTFLMGLHLTKKIMEIMNEDIDMQSIPL